MVFFQNTPSFGEEMHKGWVSGGFPLQPIFVNGRAFMVTKQNG